MIGTYKLHFLCAGVIFCGPEKYNDADMLVIASYSKTIGYYVSVAAPVIAYYVKNALQ